MPYPQEIIEEVRALNDIVDVVGAYVPLKHSGGNYFGLCPFHNEKTASFSVNAERQMYKCFGCGAGGNVISFIMQIENYDFIDALKLLADRAHFILPEPSQNQSAKHKLAKKKLLAEINRAAARFFYDTLHAGTDEAAAARVYLNERGVSPKTRTRFGLGLSPPEWDALYTYLIKSGYNPADIAESGLTSAGKTNADKQYDRFRGRLMFPIIDLNGQVAGFGGRVFGGGEPKYLNSPDTPLFNKSSQLYGLCLARKARTKEIILVEGYMDVIALCQAGFANTAGVLGTALTTEHTRLLKKVNCDTVTLLLDSDDAGTRAALRAIPVLLDGGLKVKALQVTGAKDPDEYIKKYGPGRFGQLLGSARSHIGFRVELLRGKYQLNDTEDRVAFTQEAAALLATLDSAIETDAYIAEIAGMTGIAHDAIRAEVGRLKQSADKPQVRTRFNARRGQNDKGLQQAKKGLIALLFTNPQARFSLKRADILTPEEMGDPVAAKLLETALEEREIQPADAVNRFETLEEQSAAADMFLGGAAYETGAEAEKALNDFVLAIKRAHINRQIESAKTDGEYDLETVKKLSEALKNLPLLYITISNG